MGLEFEFFDQQPLCIFQGIHYEMPPKAELWLHEYKPIINFINEQFYMHRFRHRPKFDGCTNADGALRPEFNQMYAKGEKKWAEIRRRLASHKKRAAVYGG